jgi:hypothetical protein
MNKTRLRSMLRDSVTRKQFESFNLVSIHYTKKAKAKLEEIIESDFFNCFSNAECSEDWRGYFTLECQEFWFTIIQLPEQANQKVSCYSIDFQTYKEELEGREEINVIKDWLNSGTIEIE